jgi:hypothetical protein
MSDPSEFDLICEGLFEPWHKASDRARAASSAAADRALHNEESHKEEPLGAGRFDRCYKRPAAVSQLRDKSNGASECESVMSADDKAQCAPRHEQKSSSSGSLVFFPSWHPQTKRTQGSQ